MDFGLCRHNNIAICGLESTDEQKLQNLSHSCFSRPPTLLTLMLVTDGQTSSRTPTFGLKRQFFGSSGGFVSVARLCLSLQELLPSLPARLQHLSNTYRTIAPFTEPPRKAGGPKPCGLLVQQPSFTKEVNLQGHVREQDYTPTS